MKNIGVPVFFLFFRVSEKDAIHKDVKNESEKMKRQNQNL